MPQTPTTAQLRAGRRIDLSRAPATDAARAFVAAAADLAINARGISGRPIGGKGRATWLSDVGLILGGVLRASFGGEVASAQRDLKGAMWTDDGAPIGCKAFWAKVDAMVAAELIGLRRGVRALAAGVPAGLPSRLWATPRLLELAASRGVDRATFGNHWRLSEAAQGRRPVLIGDPIVLRPWRVLRDGYWTEDAGPALAVPESDRETAAAMREGIERLNARLAAAAITGVVPPVFRRTFLGDLRIGGRFFSLGPGSFSQARTAERRAMTIDDEPVAEVDVQASQLTAFLSLTDPARLPENGSDPYGLPGLSRGAAKAFVAQSFGSGRAVRQWAENTKPDVRAVPVTRVRAAVLDAYPTLADIPAILPAALRAIAPGREEWAAGQHMTWREAEMLSDALGRVLDTGATALPLHDALIVPESVAGIAERALRDAFVRAFGTAPVIRVTTTTERASNTVDM